MHDLIVYLVLGALCTAILQFYSPVTKETVKQDGGSIVAFALLLSLVAWPFVFPVCVFQLVRDRWLKRKRRY